MPHRGALVDARIITIPATDLAFAKFADRIARSVAGSSVLAYETRLRRTFPRVVVRGRGLEADHAWYVYRDGTWSSSLAGPWWKEPGLPRIAVTREGWVVEASPTALGLLGIGAEDLGARHFTDFVASGALEDSMTLFQIVDEGNELTATALIRPASGHVLAVDLHAELEGDLLVSVLRLAEDVEIEGAAQSDAPPPTLLTYPETDAAFRGYAQLALSRMPVPTPDGLALRLRRLYPRAEVAEEGDHWLARREADIGPEEIDPWWTEPGLATVRYDLDAFITDANEAAVELFGRELEGHHWQEFVTPGSTEQVTAMLAILAEIGRAESRFRMPRGDGSLLEFDSYTEVEGDRFTTIMRRAAP